jgi:hypothetical protein
MFLNKKSRFAKPPCSFNDLKLHLFEKVLRPTKQTEERNLWIRRKGDPQNLFAGQRHILKLLCVPTNASPDAFKIDPTRTRTSIDGLGNRSSIPLSYGVGFKTIFILTS